MRSGTILVALAMVLGSVATAHSDPEVLLRMTTTSGDSVLGPGEDVVCYLDAGIFEVYGISIPLYVHYSNGNILGPLVHDRSVVASSKALQAFESVSLNNPTFGCPAGLLKDSMLAGFVDFDDTGWIGSGVLFRIVSGASDTGTIRFEPTHLPPAHFGTASVDSGVATVIWDGPVIVIDEALYTGSPLPEMRVRTHSGSDTLFVGGPSKLIFSVNPKSFELTHIAFPGVFEFTAGNIVGPLRSGIEFVPTALAQAAFDAVVWNQLQGTTATDPDTIQWSMFDTTDPDGLATAGDVALIAFAPLDTGSFTLDTTSLAPSVHLGCFVAGCQMGMNWEPLTVHVVPCPVRMGDCNENGVINSADLIYMVNYIFKGGPDPLPMRTVGDVNCTGGLGGSDIIYLVNYLFKSGPAPCGCYVSVI